jgi:hypothetical protein
MAEPSSGTAAAFVFVVFPLFVTVCCLFSFTPFKLLLASARVSFTILCCGWDLSTLAFDRGSDTVDWDFRFLGVVTADEIPEGVLDGDDTGPLVGGVDGHDLRVAGKVIVLDETFFVTEDFRLSFRRSAD